MSVMFRVSIGQKENCLNKLALGILLLNDLLHLLQRTFREDFFLFCERNIPRFRNKIYKQRAHNSFQAEKD